MIQKKEMIQDSINGIIFDIKKFAVHDGPGIRTTVFLKGCPAHCLWCHNPESQDINPEPFIRQHQLDGKIFKDSEQAGYRTTVKQIMDEILRDRVFMEQSGGGVTFSGGEPFMQADFLFGLLTMCRSEGIHIAVDTAGYVSNDVLRQLTPLVDLFLFDLKIIDPHLHEQQTGVSNELIFKNLHYILKEKCRIRIRFPVIPGITDTKDNLQEVKTFINEIADRTERLDLLAFHKIAREKYHRFGREFKMDDIDEPSAQHIHNVMKFFSDLPLTVSIGG
jgi:pyruvate formate lyase activating enzyme